MHFKTSITRINSIEELKEVVQAAREFRGIAGMTGNGLYAELYRGQGSNEWKLEPGIVRKVKNANDIQRIEQAMVRKFQLKLNTSGLSHTIQNRFLNYPFHNEWLWIQQAQHFRLPTRFMDWTASWETALLFAVGNPEHDDIDGQFWIYMVPPGWYQLDDHHTDYLNSDPFRYEPTIFINPAGFMSEEYQHHLGERRKFIQNGRFCVQNYENCLLPLEEQPAHRPNLTKIVIPKELKPTLRENYAFAGWTVEKLYVDENQEINDIVNDLRKEFGV